ncbi:Flp family type IVb pilin [Sphingobium sp. DEHP117]|uniref:Flp family type IVb pilin n=1 Tax=Sphingobium sp. DEHP117 TaxID=2993436 RepID=UPI0027D4BB62|nr:Flp family type IVb pilin [Sphingobium sp. DEHP117]MDQ4419067.1 Flp family type IVb pilin [Sphingobium sp. DEHP117]
MTNLFHRIAPGKERGLLRCNRGATAIEYGVILAMIALAIVGSLSFVAGQTGNMWNNVAQNVTNAG